MQQYNKHGRWPLALPTSLALVLVSVAASPAAAQGLLGGLFGSDDAERPADSAAAETASAEKSDSPDGGFLRFFQRGEDAEAADERDEDGVDDGAHGPGLAVHPSVHPAPFPEGAWRVRWGGTDGLVGYVGASKGLELDSWEHPDGRSWIEQRRDPDADWTFTIVAGRSGQDSDVYGASLERSSGELALQYGYYLLGQWGGRAELRRVGPDTLFGQWEYGERKGAEVWTRVNPSLSRVEFHSEVVDEAAPGEPGLVRTHYRGPEYDIRGNRPQFSLLLVGEDLWGPATHWIDHSSGLEVFGDHAYICADGSGWNYWGDNWSYCLRDGRGGLAAIRFGITVWENAAPGPKTLYFNGRPIPFMLEVRNWPDPVERALAQTLVAVSLDGEPLDAVLPGEPFRLETTFEATQDEEWIAAEADWAATARVDGALGLEAENGTAPTTDRRRILLRRQPEGKTFRSEPIALYTEESRAEVDAGGALERFTGAWRVGHMDLDGREAARGEAVVGRVNDDVVLTLTRDDQETMYRPVSVRADFFGPDARPFRGSIEAVFVPVEASEPGELDRVMSFVGLGSGAVEAPPEVDLELPISAEQQRVQFRSGDASAALEIEEPVRNDLLHVNVMARDSLNEMTGSWRIGEGDGRRTEGEASWIRAVAEIEGIVVVDDQTVRPEANYPFTDAEASRGASRARTLVVYGRNLPDEAGQASIESLSPGVAYADVSPFRTSGDHRAVQALEKAGIADRASYDLLALTVQLSDGAAAGRQNLTIDGTAGSWELDFADWAQVGEAVQERLEAEREEIRGRIDSANRQLDQPTFEQTSRLEAEEALNEAGTDLKWFDLFINKIPQAQLDQFQQELAQAMEDDPELVAELLSTDRAGLAGWLNRHPAVMETFEGTVLPTLNAGTSVVGSAVSFEKAMLSLEQDKYADAVNHLLDAGLSTLKMVPPETLKTWESRAGRSAEPTAQFLKNIAAFTNEITRPTSADKPLDYGLLIKEGVGMLYNGYTSLPDEQRRHFIERSAALKEPLERLEDRLPGAKRVVGLLDAAPQIYTLYDEWDTGKTYVNISDLAQKLGPKTIGALVFASTQSEAAADAAEFVAQQGSDYLAGLGREAREATLAALQSESAGAAVQADRLRQLRRLAAQAGLNQAETASYQALTTAIGGQQTEELLYRLRSEQDVNAIRQTVAAYRRLEEQTGHRAAGVNHFYEVVQNEDEEAAWKMIADFFSLQGTPPDPAKIDLWKQQQIDNARQTLAAVDALIEDYSPGTAAYEFLERYRADLDQMVRLYG